MGANAIKSKKIVPKNNDEFSSARELLVSNIRKALKKANKIHLFPYYSYRILNICLYNENQRDKLLIVMQALGQEYRQLSYRESGFNWTIGRNKGDEVGYNSPKEFFIGNRITTSTGSIATGNKRKLVANMHFEYTKEELVKIPTERVAINLAATRKHNKCFIAEINLGEKNHSGYVEIPNEAVEQLIQGKS